MVTFQHELVTLHHNLELLEVAAIFLIKYELLFPASLQLCIVIACHLLILANLWLLFTPFCTSR